MRFKTAPSSTSDAATPWLPLASLIASVFLLCHGTAFAETADENRPNVLIFLADDQGWGDLSLHGNRNLSTPNIDSIANEGIRFENFYVCAVCAPTRAEFLTGRYHPRTGVSGVSRGEERLNPDEITLADQFKHAGYRTGAFGKWHNGTQAPYHPNDRGFDEFYGFTSGHWGAYFSPPLDHNGKTVRGNGYVANDFTDHAIEFITANRDHPFLCYVPFNTPHSPMFVEDRFYDRFEEMDPVMKYRDADREDIMMTRAALAMVENLDWNVGRVLQTLDQLDLAENTIVIYFSDNGPNSFRWNGGMKGKKATIDEGGLRSPLLIRWPNHLRAGRTIQTVVGAIDLLPTLAELTNIKLQPTKTLDGVSFAGQLQGRVEAVPDRTLFSFWRKTATARTQRFRLDSDGKLFDIETDRGQIRNVASEHPELASRLKKETGHFRNEMKGLVEAASDRPFTVGHADQTVLPARDAVADGPSITRSSKAPNNSFFENWGSLDDRVTWDTQVVRSGTYEVILQYTCRAEDVGTTIRLSDDKGNQIESKIMDAFDPPLYDKSKERVSKSHYFVKDFKPHSLGSITLTKGRNRLQLSATKIVGEQAIDLHSIKLIWKP